jgi:hypothetical protein
MSAYECYKEYLALKNHFQRPDFDYFKYNGKTSGNVNSFSKRKDRLLFEKLAKHEDPRGLMLSNLVHDNRKWIRDMAYSEAAQKIYMDWAKRQQSLMYVFKQDLSRLRPDFNSNLVVGAEESHPYLLRAWMKGEVSLETVVILVDMTGCGVYWRREMQYDPVAEDMMSKIEKYRPFVKYDRERARKVVIDTFADSYK